MSNPEIAQALFVTRKTVEKHLGGVYRKLDVASRAELADVLGDQSSDSASAAARSPARTAPSM
jgi:DNA-binding NarL/FixJ family response regulator